MLNYEVPPEILNGLVPKGTELESYRGRTLVSLVGFLFAKTRVRGLMIPFHQNFEEVNLRFYVRRKTENEDRRGVVFVKEIVPRFLVAYVANRFYHERYVSMPMRHAIEPGRRAQYAWRFQGRWNSVEVATFGEAYRPAAGSEEEFITEHYWGYTAQPGKGAMEYHVAHPVWRVWRSKQATLDCDVAALYGHAFGAYLSGEPSTAFLAEGSEVTVYEGNLL